MIGELVLYTERDKPSNVGLGSLNEISRGPGEELSAIQRTENLPQDSKETRCWALTGTLTSF